MLVVLTRTVLEASALVNQVSIALGACWAARRLAGWPPCRCSEVGHSAWLIVQHKPLKLLRLERL